MYEQCRVAQVIAEMKRYKLDILGVSESRWTIYIIHLQKIRKYYPLEELIFPQFMLLEIFEKL